MREIKFRGKEKNRWLYGDFLHQDKFNRAMIKQDNYTACIEEETLGQYVGLKDKNGKEIYEGDILSLSIHFKKYGVIKWNDNLGGFYIYKIPSYTLKYANMYEVVRKYLG